MIHSDAFVGMMQRNYEAFGEDPNEVLTFKNQQELQTYMQNRLIELGFDTAVRDALRNMFETLDNIASMYIICYNLDCFISVLYTVPSVL